MDHDFGGVVMFLDKHTWFFEIANVDFMIANVDFMIAEVDLSSFNDFDDF